MRLKNVLIVVSDMERAKKFYCGLFGLMPILEQKGKTILTEGLVLQEESVWTYAIGQEVARHRHGSELYFEERDLAAFVRRLEELYPETVYLNRMTESERGRQMVRFYDPDGNIVEVGTPV